MLVYVCCVRFLYKYVLYVCVRCVYASVHLRMSLYGFVWLCLRVYDVIIICVRLYCVVCDVRVFLFVFSICVLCVWYARVSLYYAFVCVCEDCCAMSLYVRVRWYGL